MAAAGTRPRYTQDPIQDAIRPQRPAEPKETDPMKLKVIIIAGGLGLASLGAVGAYALSSDVRQGVKAGEAAITLVGHRHGWGASRPSGRHGAEAVQ